MSGQALGAKRRGGRSLSPWEAVQEVLPDFWKERIPFQHCGRDKDRGRRRHVSPCPVRGVGELEPVERFLKERCPTAKRGESS